MIKGLLPIKAPQYLLLFSQTKPGYLINAGFMLQQIDLSLSTNGIGSCWVGLAKPSKEACEISKLDFVIALAFGEPAETLHRTNISQFKRKSLEQIATGNVNMNILEAARLAPSATNNQPWHFVFKDNCVHCYCIKSGFLKAIFYEKMNQIDMGIALLHLSLAAEKNNMTWEMYDDTNAKENPPEGYYYIRSLHLNK